MKQEKTKKLKLKKFELEDYKYQLLDHLTPKQKNCFLLYIEGYSYEEIAIHTNQNINRDTFIKAEAIKMKRPLLCNNGCLCLEDF